MRRWLAFLLVFAAGLAILFWVQGRRPWKPVPPTPAAPDPAQPGAQEIPLTEVPIKEGEQIGIAAAGAFKLSHFYPETGAPRDTITARDSHPTAEGLYEFIDLHGRYFDLATGDVAVEFTAEKASARLVTEPAIDFDPHHPARLTGVKATLHKGTPLVPIELRVPHLEGTLSEKRLTSDDPVEIDGQGLSARGTGLDLDVANRAVRLERDARVELDLGGPRRATLDAAGGLSVRSLPEGTVKSVEIEARDRAQFDFASDKPLRIEADLVRLFGHASPDKSKEFVLTRAIAEGHVRLTPADGVFSGERAEVVLDDQGQPRSASLSGNPQVELLLRDVAQGDLPPNVAPPGGELPVRISGAGPLTLKLAPHAKLDTQTPTTEEPEFDFRGPATLFLPTLEATLTAQTNLRGWSNEKGSVGSLLASGGAVLQVGESTLEADSLELSRSSAEGAPVAARLIASGRTVARGPRPEGGTFELIANEGLEYVRERDSFKIRSARGVELTTTGPGAATAKARSVTDLDGVTLAFTAEGDVIFSNEAGAGSADRVVAYSKSRVDLFGSPDRPARFGVPEGEIQASSIEYEDGVAHARGGVTGEIAVGQRTYRLTSRWLDLARTGSGESARVAFDAGGLVNATLEDPEGRVTLRAELVHGEGAGVVERDKEITPERFTADGNVSFESTGANTFSGHGQHLEIDEMGLGRLTPPDGARVHVEGKLPKDALAFRMDATQFDFAPGHLFAKDPEIEIDGVEIPFGKSSTAPRPTLRAVAGSMSSDSRTIVFNDSVYLGQVGEGDQSWSLDAEKVLLTGERDPLSGDDKVQVRELLAWGGFTARFGPTIEASGLTLALNRERNMLSLVGAPARLTRGPLTATADWFDINLQTGFLKSSAGSLESSQVDQADQAAWKLTYLSLEPFEGPDSTLQIVRGPVISTGDGKYEVRASWALFWLDNLKLAEMSEGLTGRAPETVPEADIAPPLPKRPTQGELFAKLDETGLAEYLREVYLEGNIEILVDGEQRVRSEAVYLDLIDGHGWIRDIDITFDQDIGRRVETFKLHADWLRHSRDGSFRGERAVLTTCTFDEPHYEITIGDIRVKPRLTRKARMAAARGDFANAQETDGWDISARNNGVHFGKTGSLPLPKFGVPLGSDFKIADDGEDFSIGGLPSLSFGNSAKLGAFVGVTFVRPLGWVAQQVDNLIGGKPEFLDGKMSYHASYQSSRGPLLSAESTMQSQGLYKLVTELDVIPDRGEDKGLVQVDEDDRDLWRVWIHSRGRYLLGKHEWIDLALTHQSDPGIQAEFYERDFLRYEQRENYLHWRKADGTSYASATAEVRLESFRTEVVEQPSANFYRGRAPMMELFGRTVNYSSDTRADRILRKEGDPRFEPPFPDGKGERDTARFDTTHRVEMPLDLGAFGLRADPYLEGRGTAWSNGDGSGGDPTRGALTAGVEFATTLWKRLSDGDLHSVTPSVGYRGDLVVEENGSTPFVYDSVEDPIEGQFVDLGLRSRWLKPVDPRQPDKEERFFDVELRQTHATDVAAGQPSGWQPLRFNAAWLSTMFGVPFGMTHDGRYDLAAGETEYSRSFFGVRPIEKLELETGYHSARDTQGVRLYNAFSLGARYFMSEKWELEGRETLSTLSGSRLSSGLTVRRFGHDIVFELEFSFTAGEGSSVSVNLTPMLLWRPPSAGLLDRWRNQDN